MNIEESENREQLLRRRDRWVKDNRVKTHHWFHGILEMHATEEETLWFERGTYFF